MTCGKFHVVVLGGMMFRLIVALAALFGLSLGLVFPNLVSAQDDHDLRIVITRDTNLYAEPSTDAEVLTVIPEGTTLYYHHEVSNGFMSQSYDGQNGWMELDAFVSYADYYGTGDNSQEGTGDVSSLPDTGAGTPVGASFTLPLLALAALGFGGAAFTLRRRATH